MSAYQVSTDTIDLILSALRWTEERHHGGIRLYVPSRGGGGMVSGEPCPVDVYTGEAAAHFSRHERGGWLLDVGLGDCYEVVGRELVAANCASVAARYPDDTTAGEVGGMIGYLPEDYVPRLFDRDRFATWGHVFGALACFEYQSCETCRPTLAEAITEHVRRRVASAVADEAEADTGVHGWGWGREEAAERRAESRARILGQVRS